MHDVHFSSHALLPEELPQGHRLSAGPLGFEAGGVGDLFGDSFPGGLSFEIESARLLKNRSLASGDIV